MRHPLCLKPRQAQAVKLVADGLPRKAIGAAMNISMKTVEWHIAQAKKRLGIVHTAGLIKWAFSHGLSDLD